MGSDNIPELVEMLRCSTWNGTSIERDLIYSDVAYVEVFISILPKNVSNFKEKF